MSEHTKGPWRVEEGIHQFCKEPGHAIKGNNTEGVNIIAFLWTRHVEVEQEANARRIVACVNACEGIPTEALECQAKKEITAKLIEQNRELRDSLIELSNWMRDHTGPRDGTMEMLIKAMEVVGNASQEQGGNN
jgi:hypothetical protein